jgi:hypothetical protein
MEIDDEKPLEKKEEILVTVQESKCYWIKNSIGI